MGASRSVGKAGLLNSLDDQAKGNPVVPEGLLNGKPTRWKTSGFSTTSAFLRSGLNQIEETCGPALIGQRQQPG